MAGRTFYRVANENTLEPTPAVVTDAGGSAAPTNTPVTVDTPESTTVTGWYQTADKMSKVTFVLVVVLIGLFAYSMYKGKS